MNSWTVRPRRDHGPPREPNAHVSGPPRETGPRENPAGRAPPPRACTRAQKPQGAKGEPRRHTAHTDRFGETTTASASHARDGAPHTPHTGKVEAPPHPTRTAAVKGLAFRSRSTQICEIAQGEGGRREGGNRDLYSCFPAIYARPSQHTADVLSSPSHGPRPPIGWAGAREAGRAHTCQHTHHS